MSSEKKTLEQVFNQLGEINNTQESSVQMAQMTVRDKSLEVDYLKEVFKKYFKLDVITLNQIFSPKRLIVTEVFSRLKKYFELPEPLYLNYLVILEFINLAQLEHDGIELMGDSSNLKVNLDREDNCLIDKELVRKILSGDLFIVLAIQEINQLSKSSASDFFAMIKKFYDRKVQASLFRIRERRSFEKLQNFSENNSNDNSKNSLLKFILFLSFEDNNTKINHFYQSFVNYLGLLKSLKVQGDKAAEVQRIKSEIAVLEAELMVDGEAVSGKKFAFPVDELLGLVNNPQVYSLIEKLV